MTQSAYPTYQHYGTNAERIAFVPDPSSGQPIYIWFEDDTGDVYLYDTTWHLISGGAGSIRAIPFTISGGGAVITTGLKYGVYVPYACEIVEWTLGADQTGSIVIDIWVDSYANFPPDVGDSITASDKPEISTDIKAQSSALTGWDPVIPAGSWIYFNVDSVTDIEFLMGTLKVTV